MAVLKTLNGAGRYHNEDARELVTRYITNPDKAKSGLIGVTATVNPNDIAESLNQTAIHFKKQKGVQLRHFALSFHQKEAIIPYEAYEIGREIIGCIGQEYQAVFAVHENTDELHLHLMFHSVSYLDGHRYRGTRRDYYDLVNCIKHILHRHGIKILSTASFSSEHTN